MWDNKNLPKFGPLAGVKVVHATLAQAAPLGAQFLAEYGADVIWVENALTGDVSRYTNSFLIEQDRKNQRTIALNIPTPEGKEILLKLIKEADIFIENSKGGQYAKWGLTDEVLWEVNPKLVIAHITGYGLTGIPEYVNRPAFDTVVQAYAGMSFTNANPNGAYASPYFADMAGAVFTAMSVLAALNKAKETGIGESIDIAQFEILMRLQQYMCDWFSAKYVYEQAGYPSAYGGCGVFTCKDGKQIQTHSMGAGVLRNIIPFLGLEYGGKLYPENISMVRSADPNGAPLTEALKAYLLTKTAVEAEEELQALGLPCNKINDYQDVEDDPHVNARGMITEWKSFKGTDVRCVGIVPKFKKNPGKMWRPAPYMGMDNEEILGQLGYSTEFIEELYKKKVISNDKDMNLCVPMKGKKLGW